MLAGAVGVATGFAGCSASTSTGSFTQTTVEEQQLVVAFDDSLDPAEISVIDPEGASFATTAVSAGVTRVTFDIPMPYTPGEYRIVATDGENSIAETSLEIRPALEIVDVGVGANRMEEMPEELGHTQDEEALVRIRNSGNGPESIERMHFLGDIPNPNELDEGQTGIFDPASGGERHNPLLLNGEEQATLFSSTLPFLFEGDGISCSSEPQTGRMTIEIWGKASGQYTKDFQVEYSAAESNGDCVLSIEGEF